MHRETSQVMNGSMKELAANVGGNLELNMLFLLPVICESIHSNHQAYAEPFSAITLTPCSLPPTL
jgi:hypothetical protein